jgi:hypothetical protein
MLAVSALVIVLAAAILLPVFTADAAILSKVAEATITVSEACDDPAIDLKLAVKDQAGNIIKQTTAHTQVFIEGTVNFNCNKSAESPIVLFEVRDGEGITTYLAWQRFSGESSGQVISGSSWTPDRPGIYEVRFFYIACLSCPMVLNPVVTYEITVI